MTQIQIQPSKDAYIFSTLPDNNYGFETFLQLYYMTLTPSRIIRSLVSFNIPTLDTIHDVKLWYYQYTTLNQDVDIHLLQKDYVENEVSWNKASNIDVWQLSGGDYNIIPLASILSSHGWNNIILPISIIPLGQQSIIGLLIKFKQESNLGKNVAIVSKDSTSISPITGADLLKPYLEINTDVPCPSLSATMELI